MSRTKDLSISKWEFLVRHPMSSITYLLHNNPFLKDMPGLEPYCAEYRTDDYDFECSKCPLHDPDYLCCKEVAEYRDLKTSERAEAVLNRIKELPE